MKVWVVLSSPDPDSCQVEGVFTNEVYANAYAEAQQALAYQEAANTSGVAAAFWVEGTYWIDAVPETAHTAATGE